MTVSLGASSVEPKSKASRIEPVKMTARSTSTNSAAARIAERFSSSTFLINVKRAFRSYNSARR